MSAVLPDRLEQCSCRTGGATGEPSRSHPRTTDDLLIKQNLLRLMRLAQNPELQGLHPGRVTLLGAEGARPEDSTGRWRQRLTNDHDFVIRLPVVLSPA